MHVDSTCLLALSHKSEICTRVMEGGSQGPGPLRPASMVGMRAWRCSPQVGYSTPTSLPYCWLACRLCCVVPDWLAD